MTNFRGHILYMPYITRLDHAMGQLQLTCLGNFYAVLNGRPLTAFQTDKVRALLVYLAVETEPHLRTELTQFLWPGYSEESANNSLRQTLHRLRYLLKDDEADPPWLLITRQTVQINPAASIRVDASDFARLMAECTAHNHLHLAECQPCLTRLQAAVDLYQSDFLADFSVADSERFEEWRRIKQEQLHIQRLDALSWLAAAAEATGNDEKALDAAQRQLKVEPWLEAAHRLIMRILARRGQRVAANVQYQRCCQVLAEELGTTPEQETKTLHEQIQKGFFDKTNKPPRPLPQRNEEVPASPAVGRYPALPHNLPLLDTPLIGRESELKELGTRLQQPDVRLLTLVGAGGMGKTHLALALAQRILNESATLQERKLSSESPKFLYPDGVFFVPLAPLTTSEAIIPAVATCLRLETHSAPQQVLQHFLQKRQLLLILDNFEHLLDGSDLLVTLLQDAPGLQILVTSRERLNVRGETLFPLTGLEFGRTVTQPSPKPSAAAQLFVHYARQSHSEFAVNEAELVTIAQICQLLQGMPLALEMAAAWTLMLPLEEIGQEIAKNADFLRTDWPDVPARQRSMRAVFTWSWQLLTESERRGLRQLALFTGSFTRAAAEQIADVSLRTLISLLNKSLLHYAHTNEGVTPTSAPESGSSLQQRYELHVLVRQFANEQLITAQEEATVAARYCTFYLNFLTDREASLLGSAVSKTVAEIQLEFDPIRRAWRWAIDRGEWDAIERSAYCLSEFAAIVGRYAEVEQLFQLAVERCEDRIATGNSAGTTVLEQQRTLSLLLALLALAQYRQGKANALPFAQQAIQLGSASGSVIAQFLGYYTWALLDIVNGWSSEVASHFAQAQQILEQVRKQGLENFRLLDLGWRYHLGMVAYAIGQGQYADAKRYGEEGLQIAEELGSLRGQCFVRLNLIHLYEEAGAFANIRQEVDALLPLVLAMRWRWAECVVYQELGNVQKFAGEFGAALVSNQKALSIAQEIGEGLLEVGFALESAYLYKLVGNSQRAEAMLPTWSEDEKENSVTPLPILALMRDLLWRWQEGNLNQARTVAMQVYALGVKTNHRWHQVCALVYLGHIQYDLQDLTAAAEDYHKALALCQTLDNPTSGMEPSAGLAKIALRQGNLGTAQQWVEQILPLLPAPPCIITTPIFGYLTCYQVLAANGDRRAISVLQQGHDLLQQIAADLDEETRHGFLETVPVHRELAAAYRAWQTQEPGKLPPCLLDSFHTTATYTLESGKRLAFVQVGVHGAAYTHSPGSVSGHP